VNLKAAKSKKEKEKEKDMYAKQNSILSAKRSYFPFFCKQRKRNKKREIFSISEMKLVGHIDVERELKGVYA